MDIHVWLARSYYTIFDLILYYWLDRSYFTIVDLILYIQILLYFLICPYISHTYVINHTCALFRIAMLSYI